MQDLPHGFRRHVGGLIVPEEVSRVQQVWTRDEWRLLDRATKLMNAHGLNLQLQCQNQACQATKIERMRRPDGTKMLRCEHMDRVVHPGT